MAKKSNEFYRLALLGGIDKKTGEVISYGLRETAAGFAARNGYNLHDINSWTPAQKGKLTRYWHELQNLTAQPRYLYKTRDRRKLEVAQRVVQSESGLTWKVAFIPHTPGKTRTGKLSKAKPIITFSKAGIRIRERKYTKHFIPLDPTRLAKAPKRTINEAIKENAPKAQRFTIMARANEMQGADTKESIVGRVIKLMTKYDGKTEITSGRHRGDNPKAHAAKDWLTGLTAYEFPRVTQESVSGAVNEFNAGRLALQKRRRAQRKRIAATNTRAAAKARKAVAVPKAAHKPKKATKK